MLAALLCSTTHRVVDGVNERNIKWHLEGIETHPSLPLPPNTLTQDPVKTHQLVNIHQSTANGVCLCSHYWSQFNHCPVFLVALRNAARHVHPFHQVLKPICNEIVCQSL